MTFQVLVSWCESGRGEAIREYEATSLSEALSMAERADAGKADAPEAYGVLARDFDLARAEGISFNEADGLLLDSDNAYGRLVDSPNGGDR